MKSVMRQLLLRFFVVYTAVMGVAVAGILLSNAYISRFPADAVKDRALGLFGYAAIWIVILLAFTYWRLRRDLQKRLYVFPRDVFWFNLLVATVTTQVYFFKEYIGGYLRGEERSYVILHYFKSSLFNLTSFTMMAMGLYVLSRWVLRTFIRKIPSGEFKPERFDSFAKPIITTGIVLFSVIGIRLHWYVLDSSITGKSADITVVVVFSAVAVAVSAAILYLLLLQYRKEMLLMVSRFRNLADGPSSDVTSGVPVLSMDEAGEMAFLYNQLQKKMRSEYVSLEKDVVWANSLLGKMLPPANGRSRGVEWTFHPGSNETPGIFYDRLDRNGRVAYLVGFCEEKGLSAVLISLTAMLLFRVEAAGGASASDAVLRLASALNELSASPYPVHLAVVVESSEAAIDRLDYAMTAFMKVGLASERVFEIGFADDSHFSAGLRLEVGQ